jgi:hypothetical protein
MVSEVHEALLSMCPNITIFLVTFMDVSNRLHADSKKYYTFHDL